MELASQLHGPYTRTFPQVVSYMDCVVRRTVRLSVGHHCGTQKLHLFSAALTGLLLLALQPKAKEAYINEHCLSVIFVYPTVRLLPLERTVCSELHR